MPGEKILGMFKEGQVTGRHWRSLQPSGHFTVPDLNDAAMQVCFGMTPKSIERVANGRLEDEVRAWGSLFAPERKQLDEQDPGPES